jgi:DNA replication protein
MSEFNGFPPGDLKFTSIPDLFFARLLPQIDDLAELKVILHILWMRQREAKQAISLAELQTDETLIQSLSIISEKPYEALTYGLKQAVLHKALLHARIENDEGPHEIYLLNSEGGRMTLEKIQAGEVGVVAISGVDVVSPRSQRANIVQLYEANIGLLSPILADELKDAEMTYPQEWIEDAIKIAVENNVRKWSYIRAVLERMSTEGRSHGIGKQINQPDTSKRWFTDEEYEQLLKH